MNTGIEWTDRVWNPTTGCDRVSPGCDHCYALTMAKRLKGMGSAKYQTDGDPRTSGPGFGVATHPDTLVAPFGWRTPQRVFVNSMSDLFHARVPLSFVLQVFDVMAATPQHTYQLLTKRPRRVLHFGDQLHWPDNVWMGVSVEDGDHLGRVEDLRAVPAAVRFLSCEPLLGSLNALRLDGIGWVIAGGESGPKARPMHPDWVRSLRDQCAAEAVPFLFKQWGGWAPVEPDTWENRRETDWVIRPDGYAWPLTEPHGAETGYTVAETPTIRRVGKKAAGRLLDGVLHDAYPTTREETHQS